MSLWTSTEEKNKAIVANFVADVWNAKKFEKVADYVADDYIQHNPNLPNGRSALEAFLSSFYTQNMPNGEFSIARLIADDDIVVAHSLFRVSAEDRGTAVVDIYRIENGKLIEHWDVKEQVPETSANGNPIV